MHVFITNSQFNIWYIDNKLYCILSLIWNNSLILWRCPVNRSSIIRIILGFDNLIIYQIFRICLKHLKTSFRIDDIAILLYPTLIYFESSNLFAPVNYIFGEWKPSHRWPSNNWMMTRWSMCHFHSIKLKEWFP